MILKEYNDLKWLEFELLNEFKDLSHGCFLRHGGFSQGNFSSLNFSSQIGDQPDHVKANRSKAAQSLEISRLVFPQQCHGIKISKITNSTAFDNHICDALTTQTSNIGLAICHADCQASIFYDPIQKALANVHAGWRGSVQNIYAAVIQKMKQLYGSNPENILVCISPSLGPNSAEFINYEKELPKPFWDFRISSVHFDFWQISRWQLESAGILPGHIQIANIDTYTNPNDYFSHRYSKLSARNATICALK